MFLAPLVMSSVAWSQGLFQSTFFQARSCKNELVASCNLSAGASGLSSGSCASGYTGSCSYKCNNGVWTQVSNTCSITVTFKYPGCTNNDVQIGNAYWASCDVTTNPSYTNGSAKVYTLKAIGLNSSSASASIPSGIQGICSSGYHVPSPAEWTAAQNAAGGASALQTALSITNDYSYYCSSGWTTGPRLYWTTHGQDLYGCDSTKGVYKIGTGFQSARWVTGYGCSQDIYEVESHFLRCVKD